MAINAMTRVGSYVYSFPEYETVRKNIWEGVNWRTGRTRIADAFPDEIIAKKDNETMSLTLESGSVVQFGGSNRVDSLVGGGQVGVVESEASLSRPEFGQFIAPVLEESRGWHLKIATPRGKNHFYKAYLGAKADMEAGDKSVLAAHIPASRTSVFSMEQLFRIKMNLIRDYGRTIGEAMFAQEYECSFEAAVQGAVWGEELNELYMTERVRPLKHVRSFPVHTSWDIGVSDATVILFWQQVNGEDRLIDAVDSDTLRADNPELVIGLDTYVSNMKDRSRLKGWMYGTHYGPHDIAVREWVRGLSRVDEAKRLGLIFKTMPNTRVKTQIAAAARLLRSVVVNEDSPGAMAAYEHFKAYHYPKMATNGVQSEIPVHDEHSHASSAMMTYAIAQAAKLGVTVGDADPELGGGGTEKFDPRMYGNAPYGREDNVSSVMGGRGAYRAPGSGGSAF